MEDEKTQHLKRAEYIRKDRLRDIQEDFGHRRQLMLMAHTNELWELGEEEVRAVTGVLAKYESEKIEAEARLVCAPVHVRDLRTNAGIQVEVRSLNLAAESKDAPQ